MTGDDSQRPRKIGKRLAVLAVVGLALLLGLEVAIRAFLPRHVFLDPHGDCYWVQRMATRAVEEDSSGLSNVRFDVDLGWIMRPGLVEGQERMNTRGVRSDREIPHARTPGVGRIVLVGDSFTFGLGVANDETWGAELERRLADTEVLNLGVNGYGTDQQFLYWKREGARYAPDVVLLGIYVPDFHRNTLSVRELPKPRFFVDTGELSLSPTPLATPREVLAQRYADCTSPLRLLDAFGAARRLLGGEPEEDLREKEELLSGILALFADSARAAGASPAIVVIPDRALRDYMLHDRIVSCIRTAGEAQEVPLLDLTDVLGAWDGEESAFDREHHHFTVTGHRLAGEAIHAFLLEAGLR